MVRLGSGWVPYLRPAGGSASERRARCLFAELFEVNAGRVGSLSGWYDGRYQLESIAICNNSERLF